MAKWDKSQLRDRAKGFWLLGEPPRLQILMELSTGPKLFKELRDVTGLAGPSVSHHLSLMRTAGLVTGARAGQSVAYTVAKAKLDLLAETLADVMRK